MDKMLYGRIPYVDRPVSRIVHGTMMLSMDRKEKSFELLDSMVRQGVNTFDTAAVYGDGEIVLGAWMRERANRDRVLILTKGAHHNKWRKRVTPYDILSDVYDSLAKLMIDKIDIYILHRDNPEVPAGPIVEVLNSLHDSGKIGAFGGSNWTHKRIEEANEYAYKYGLIPFTVSSPNYSLADQVENPWGPGCVTLSGPEGKEAREWYKKKMMPVFSYSSLGRGFFSGRLRSDEIDKASKVLDGAAIKGYSHPVNFERLKRAEKLAKEKDISIAQVAMAWLMKQPLNIYALAGTNTAGEMKENIEALNIEIKESELDWLLNG